MNDSSTSRPVDQSVPLCELRGITKAFPGVVANDNIDLDLYPGEVHALLGENGAGKSTLISIVSGMYAPDSGEIKFNGATVVIDSPRKAIDLGIGTVYQHLTLVPTLTVLENLMLGSRKGVGTLETTVARNRFEELARLLGAEVSPDAMTGSLSLGQQQQVEIMKALWKPGSRVLILDEPTSMLTPQGYEELRRELDHLKENGLAIVLITHKLHEAFELGDRVTVLRGGRRAGILSPDDLKANSEEDLASLTVDIMFGKQAAEFEDAVELEVAPAQVHRGKRRLGEVALEVRDLGLDGEPDVTAVRGVGFSLRAGEILGIAGVDGNGQREVAQMIAGQRRPGQGTILMFGQDVARLGVRGRERLGLRYVTDDRLGEGTVTEFDVATNAVLKRIGTAPFWRAGAEQRDEIDRFAQGLVERFDVRTPGLRTRVGTLSGGNVQKLLLARELAGEPRIVLFNKPTHGLDLLTAEFVRRQIREGADAGIASLVISTELDELISLCDRILVMSRGEVTGEVENRDGVEERVGTLMTARTGAAS